MKAILLLLVVLAASAGAQTDNLYYWRYAGAPSQYDSLDCADTCVASWYWVGEEGGNNMNVQITVVATGAVADTLVVEERRYFGAGLTSDSVFIRQMIFQPKQSNSTDSVVYFRKNATSGSKLEAQFIVYMNYMKCIRIRRLSPATYKPSIKWYYWIDRKG